MLTTRIDSYIQHPGIEAPSAPAAALPVTAADRLQFLAGGKPETVETVAVGVAPRGDKPGIEAADVIVSALLVTGFDAVGK